MPSRPRPSARYAIPGFVFFAQNNLSFIALQHMSNAAFQLLLNMRIVAVALLTVMVLGKQLNKIKWFAIVLLTNGAVQYQLSGCSENGGALKTSAEGLMVMMVRLTALMVCAPRHTPTLCPCSRLTLASIVTRCWARSSSCARRAATS